ncbi:glycoside hydrolase family 6 protein [Demequina iriomotensis]|uniref:glycoside hydrolase family 6 protein n=1 Tax=Demequina iriomotensis TaxID=1536641 RepID=UPI000785E91F|nr:glycoside hydrolase family 6 protein [Demequina iriomotensis]
MRIRSRAVVAVVGLLALAGCTGDAQPDPSAPGTASAGPDAPVRVSADGHVDNAYAGASMYVDADWTSNVLASAGEADDAVLAASMRAVSGEPTAVWLDRIQAVTGTATERGLEEHLDAAVAQASQDPDGEPVVVTLVVYDLPGRDCHALASSGELAATDADMARYRSEYIDVIADLLARDEYRVLRIVTVIEPDSLPNLVTNADDEACQAAAPYYREGVVYALDAFAPLEHVYAYLDAGHAGWLGWTDNAEAAVALFADVAGQTRAGLTTVDGFVTDVAGYTPLEEPFLEASDLVDGTPVSDASFYASNPDLDEAAWAADLHARVLAAGFPDTTGIVIDTSRNGWGGIGRPAAASSSTTLDTYVDESRVDRRVHRGAWCNPEGAGLGERPVAEPEGYPDAHLDAFMWVKPPGESDGSSRLVANDQGKGFDPMCDPTYTSDRLDGALTHALPDAPISGAWFPAQFAQLVANAYPAVGSEGGDGSSPDALAGSCSAVLTITDSWSSGYVADVTVTAGAPLSTWSVTLPPGTVLDDLWNGVEADGRITPLEWNATLDAGGTANFGYVGAGDTPAAGALACASA